jgi:hypothetical protein
MMRWLFGFMLGLLLAAGGASAQGSGLDVTGVWARATPGAAQSGAV